MSCPGWPRSFALAFVVVTVSACSTMRADPAREWVSPIGRDHPLAGVTFEVATGRVVSEQELAAAVSSADFVLLGEQHDNADHHLLQAALLGKILAAGRRPAVAFEQINLEDQASVDRALATAAGERPQTAAGRASAVASAVKWEKSGWPPFDQYRPVFEAALSAQLPVRAANLSRKQLFERHAAKTPAPADEAPLVPLSEEMHASMVAEIIESHCGYAEPNMVSMMVEAQRRRDTAMAEAVNAALAVSAGRANVEPAAPAANAGVPATSPAGVVLICGLAHARNDYGVPLSLRRLAPGRRIVSVGFLEVSADADNPADYADAFHASRLPFDFVSFTPRADATDPCEKYRVDLQKMKSR